MAVSIDIIGKGAFGQALHAVYSATDADVRLHGRDFPQSPKGDYVFLAIPTHAVAQVVKALIPNATQPWVLCCKGILPSGALPSSLIPVDQPYAVLSGPGFAHELKSLLPTVHSLATSSQHAPAMADRLSTGSLRLYWTTDTAGVQICGALKNILAIASGIAGGLQLGENARAALIARGVQELRRCLLRFGGHEDTIWSPAGIGDLSLTCNSDQSRNFRFGQKIAQGISAKEAEAQIGTVEGVKALNGVLGQFPRDELPIIFGLADVLADKQDAKEAVAALMTRPVTAG